MKIIDVFDAVKLGTYDDFKKVYKNDIDEVNNYTKLNLLQTVLTNENKVEDKIKIIKHLIIENIDINYLDIENKQNALHIFYSNFRIKNVEYLLAVTKILVEKGININQRDAFGAIPMQYLISVNKLPTIKLKELFMYLLKNKAEYTSKDNYNKSCLDYAAQFSWRNDFIEIVEEFENANK